VVGNLSASDAGVWVVGRDGDLRRVDRFHRSVFAAPQLDLGKKGLAGLSSEEVVELLIDDVVGTVPMAAR